ncbi:MAG TPA: glycosyltransferase family 39 protein [Candidatus Obscuribacterales bacterium]
MPVSRRLLIIHTILITLIVVGTLMRVGHCFIYNPLESLWSDNERHFHNAFDVKGDDVESILNPPGFEIFLSTVFRITYKNRTLISLVMAFLSVATPYLWYRWLRELTKDKTISLIGYMLLTFLPSFFKIFGYFMDSVILLPLTGAALWLTWRAARKATWGSCAVAAVFCGAACCTKSTALAIVGLPWLYVAYELYKKLPKWRALRMAAAGMAIVGCFYLLGPLKVWTHTGCIVLLPDGIYNARYFESGAHDIEVDSLYNRDGGEWVQGSIWGSSSVCYPPLYPFSNWLSKRTGRYKMEVNYRGLRETSPPIKMSLRDRLYYTWENIIFFFFEYQWPEDQNWQDPFPRNLDTFHRFLWLPITLFIAGAFIWLRKRDFMTGYFLAVTLLFMFQQSAVMEGRYKKLWDGVAVVALLNVMARTKRYQSWINGELQPVLTVQAASPQTAAEPASEPPESVPTST